MNIKITLLTVISFYCNLSSITAQQTSAALNATPVILKGNKLSLLSAYKPADLVGFRYNGKWEQIMIQVDEMKMASGAKIYNNSGQVATGQSSTSWDGSGGPEYDAHAAGGKNAFLVYADSKTFVGADENVFFDDDDELVYMARDGGDMPPDNDLFPAGIDSCSGVQVQSTDPNTGRISYVYLFKRDLNYQSPVTGTHLAPHANLPQQVSYSFKFKSNNQWRDAAGYKEFYNRQFGPNPEESFISTPNYVKVFTDRWVEDQLYISTPPSPGLMASEKQNVIDGHKINIVPLYENEARNCQRSEYTFAGIINDFDQSPRPPDGNERNSLKGYEGAFIANISGPVRAIRSFMGANSGALTQRNHICYDKIELITTTLRLHAISGLMDYYDYSPAVGKMIYNNSNNMPPTPQMLNGNVFTGILIDGKNDELEKGFPEWELLNSLSGSIFRYNKITSDVPGLYASSYYYDDITPNQTKEPQCTGDAVSWGASGIYIKARNSVGGFVDIPHTDIRLSSTANTFVFAQYNVYLQPETPLAEHQVWLNSFKKPVDVKVTAWQNTQDCESRKKADASVFPNPSAGRFNVHIGGAPYQQVVITVYDMLGRQFYRSEKTGPVNHEINLNNTAPGVYIVTVVIDGKRISHKVMIGNN